jgi:hypothetical protein
MLNLEGLSGDVAHAWRAVVRRPGFTLAVVLTLGLGIGANTAVFGLIDSVILSPLPYEDSGELYSVSSSTRRAARGCPRTRRFRTGPGRSTACPASLSPAAPPYETEGHSGFLLGSFVTEGFFDVLGVEAELGRVLTADDHLSGAGGAVVL